MADLLYHYCLRWRQHRHLHTLLPFPHKPGISWIYSSPLSFYRRPLVFELSISPPPSFFEKFYRYEAIIVPVVYFALGFYILIDLGTLQKFLSFLSV